MRLDNNFGPAQEYEALRTELQESRSYVFERPLLILGAVAGVASFGAEKLRSHPEYMAILPPLVTALMIYNLWSTAWRQRSSSRIVAYIQTALEERVQKDGRWWGWETCLREYRKKYRKLEPKQWALDKRAARLRRRLAAARIQSSCMGADALRGAGAAGYLAAERGWWDRCKPTQAGDPLMYWNALWLLHIGIVFAALLMSIFFPVRGWLDWAGFMVNCAFFIWFACVCLQKRPYKMKSHIEFDRKVWQEVLAYLDARAAREVAGMRLVSPGPGPVLLLYVSA